MDQRYGISCTYTHTNTHVASIWPIELPSNVSQNGRIENIIITSSNRTFPMLFTFPRKRIHNTAHAQGRAEHSNIILTYFIHKMLIVDCSSALYIPLEMSFNFHFNKFIPRQKQKKKTVIQFPYK